MQSSYSPKIEEIEQLTGIISLNNAATEFYIQDDFLRVSLTTAKLKQQYTKVVNMNFDNVTQSILWQKDSNLCAPICVTTLLRRAITHDLNMEYPEMQACFSKEKIMTMLTMVIYPRSLAGLNLNPKNEEKENQHFEDIEDLLKRMKYATYLNQSGWDIIRHNHVYASFDYNLGKFT